MNYYNWNTPNNTVKAIIMECRAQGLPLTPQHAYVLATVEHETAGTFKPVREAFWKSEDWRQKNLRYFPFYGRGFVQITWKRNYEKYAELTGLDLAGHPDLAMDPDVACYILVHGFKHGIFTGKKLEDYINPGMIDFLHARRCINGMDRAADIKRLAETWLKKLTEGE